MYRPHDLLWFTDPGALTLATAQTPDVPDWLADVCLHTWPVVIRRGLSGPLNRLPVGIRGARRHQRLAAWLSPDAVMRHVCPEDLAAQRPWLPSQNHPVPARRARRHDGIPPLSVMSALTWLAPRLDSFGAPWGPTGSVGYTLATGRMACNTRSDLDLIIRLKTPLVARDALLLARWFEQAPCRVDAQVETGYGAFAFEEWRHTPRNMLLKTNQGPINIALHKGESPWQRPELHGKNQNETSLSRRRLP